MDNLKKYLQEHREELDLELPDERILRRVIQPAPPIQDKGRIFRIVIASLAAAACIFAVIILTGRLQTEKPSKPLAGNSPEIEQKGPVPAVTPNPGVPADTASGKPEIPVNGPDENSKPSYRYGESATSHSKVIEDHSTVNALEKNYAELVKLQENNIRKTPVFVEGPDYFNAFKVQLKQMDNDEAQLRKDIRVNGLNNILLEQLINIYQQKLNLLKDLLTEINKVNNQVKQKSLPTDSLKTSFIKI